MMRGLQNIYKKTRLKNSVKFIECLVKFIMLKLSHISNERIVNVKWETQKYRGIDSKY